MSHAITSPMAFTDMWASKCVSGECLWQVSVWPRRTRKQGLKYFIFTIMLNSEQNRKFHLFLLKQAKQSHSVKQSARCWDGGIFSNQVGMVSRSSTISGGSAGQLGPPPSLLVELSTASHTGRRALTRSTVCQVKELRSPLAPSFLDYCIGTTTSPSLCLQQ